MGKIISHNGKTYSTVNPIAHGSSKCSGCAFFPMWSEDCMEVICGTQILVELKSETIHDHMIDKMNEEEIERQHDLEALAGDIKGEIRRMALHENALIAQLTPMQIVYNRLMHRIDENMLRLDEMDSEGFHWHQRMKEIINEELPEVANAK